MINRILYFFDPLCGWCYGFSNHLSSFYEKYKDSYDFEVITGGMIQRADARPIASMSQYIIDSYKRIENMSGAKFGQGYLDRVSEGSAVYESDTPSLMYHFFTSTANADKVKCAAEIQRLIFSEGIDPSDHMAYSALADSYGVEASSLGEVLSDTGVIEAYESSLYTRQQFGVEGFPFTIVEIEGEYYLLARGFVPSAELDRILQKAHEYHDRK